MTLGLAPITFEQAKAFILEHHRHHGPSRGWKFGIGAVANDVLRGVIVVGRPVARALDDGRTLEATRCCTDSVERNVASMLYGAAWRAAKAMGYRRLVTYTLESERGTSLLAAGFDVWRVTRGGSWDCPSRRREDKAPTTPKTLWLRQ